MNERLEQECTEYFKDWSVQEEIGLTKPDGWSCTVKDLNAIAQHFYNLALEDVKKEVEKTIGALKKQNPNPLGKITECLAASEITALETVVDFINNQKQ